MLQAVAISVGQPTGILMCEHGLERQALSSTTVPLGISASSSHISKLLVAFIRRYAQTIFSSKLPISRFSFGTSEPSHIPVFLHIPIVEHLFKCYNLTFPCFSLCQSRFRSRAVLDLGAQESFADFPFISKHRSGSAYPAINHIPIGDQQSLPSSDTRRWTW